MSRLRNEDGLTLVELLAATLIGSIVIVGAFSLLDVAAQSSRDTQERLEAVAKGRTAAEAIVRQVRSQLCVGTTPPVVEGTPTRLVFTGSLTTEPTGSNHLIQLRTLQYVPNTAPADTTQGRITESVIDGNMASTPPTFTATPRTRTLVTGVSPVGGKIFRYHTFDTANLPNTRELSPVPLSVADRRIVSHVQVTFDAMPAKGRAARQKTLVDSTVYVRSSDPTAPSPGPRCT